MTDEAPQNGPSLARLELFDLREGVAASATSTSPGPPAALSDVNMDERDRQHGRGHLRRV